MRIYPVKQNTIIYANSADFYADKILCSSECTPRCSIWPSSRMLHQWISFMIYVDILKEKFCRQFRSFYIDEFVPLVGGKEME